MLLVEFSHGLMVKRTFVRYACLRIASEEAASQKADFPESEMVCFTDLFVTRRQNPRRTGPQHGER
jgi:hypothetical protein